ncbi:MAG: 30S ribosomal protein S12 methylthiotransferase RimO [Candidatus Atribacteria bacterium]|nr:30S ribosomal protein S12 methylthiotransferase RimO [Candidatus Atribacteria bacterium]
MRVCIQSLGCPKNLVDSEVISGSLLKQNYTITNDIDNCDIAVINTCSFIQPAVEESIEAILEAAELKKEGRIKHVVVAGCLSQRYSEKELKESLPEVDGFIGIDEIAKIPEIMEQVLRREGPFRVNRKPCFLYDENSPRFLFTPNHYAYLKIAEGCNNACAYCLIPRIKGTYRSRTIESVFAEAQNLITSYPLKEIILIAEDTTYYGRDLYGEPALANLLQKLTQLKWSSENRIRILYTHPAHYNDALIDFLAENKQICPYLDLPLQHISNSMLKRMNRKIGQKDIITLIEKLRDKIPELTLRTTFIVGFPGETEQDFEELCRFVENYQFEKVGVFTYYNEPDCTAGKFDEQVTEKVKKMRLDTLMKIQQKIALHKQKTKIGKVLKVLVDGVSDKGKDILIGRSCAEAPEIDGEILVFKGQEKDIGNWVNIKITEAFPYHLEGEILADKN